MKKYRRGLRLAACLLALATCAVLLCSCLHPGKADSYTAAMPVIVVGSDNYPPFNYMGTDGAPTGIDVELATEAFGRLGYRVKFVTIDWEKKKELVENDTIDCIWGSFSMDGREEEYHWAGPYLYSRQVVAVRSDSDIHTLQDLADKVVAVQSTTKPEELFLNAEQNGLPRLRRLVFPAEPGSALYHPDQGLCGCLGRPRKRHPAVHEGLQCGVPHSGRAADDGTTGCGLCQKSQR